MKYTLMNKELPVLSFETKKTETGRLIIQNESIVNAELLPTTYKGDIKAYINRRKAPRHREHIAKLLIQLDAENLDGYIAVCNAASLTDTFWVNNEENPSTWDDVSLYRNEFDENIAKIAIDGGNATASTTSPELSVNGQYAKCWVREDKDLYLLKRGSRHYRGREVHAEYYSSQIIEKLCPNAVHYDVVMHHNKPASKCHIFTSEEFGFLPIVDFYHSGFSTEAIDFLKEFKKYDDGMNYRRMVVADALILNVDRHLGNFGYLIDNDTLKPLQMAPVFDYNRSMLFHLSPKQFREQNMEELFARPFTDGTFIDNARDMLTDEIIADLKKLHGFQFKKSGISDWADSRLQKYEQFIDTQIDQILGRTKVIIHDAPSIKRTAPRTVSCKKSNSPELEK